MHRPSVIGRDERGVEHRIERIQRRQRHHAQRFRARGLGVDGGRGQHRCGGGGGSGLNEGAAFHDLGLLPVYLGAVCRRGEPAPMAEAGSHGPEGKSFSCPRQPRLATGMANAEESHAVTIHWPRRMASYHGTMRETAR